MTDRRRILVVDDEPQITRVLRTSLSSQRYDVRVANDGETALEIMKDWTPDLVITDLSMPNMDGLELCRRLRASMHGRSTRRKPSNATTPLPPSRSAGVPCGSGTRRWVSSGRPTLDSRSAKKPNGR